MTENWIIFKNEKDRPLPPPQQIIQDHIFEDLGGWSLPPPNGNGQQFGPTAGLRIIGTPQSYFFIGQGKVKIHTTLDKLKETGTNKESKKKLDKGGKCVQVDVVGKRYSGGPGNPIIMAYDQNGNFVQRVGGKGKGEILETLSVKTEEKGEISYIIIWGCEEYIATIHFSYK